MRADDHFHFLKNLYRRAPNNAYYDPAMILEFGKARIQIKVQEKFFHGAGSVHGSVYFKLLDDAAYFAAATQEQNFFLYTARFETKLLRPVSQGLMIAEGQILEENEKGYMARSVVRDAEGKLLAKGEGLFMPSPISLHEL
jgi:uncharacterized protein (TIGR00369 family)